MLVFILEQRYTVMEAWYPASWADQFLQPHIRLGFLGFGYNPSVDSTKIERATMIHYNGNMKPWMDITIPKYMNYRDI